MTFTDEQIEEFRQLYFKRYGREVSKDEAYDQASKLLRLMILIYKPMSSEDFNAIQERRIKMLSETIMYALGHDLREEEDHSSQHQTIQDKYLPDER